MAHRANSLASPRAPEAVPVVHDLERCSAPAAHRHRSYQLPSIVLVLALGLIAAVDAIAPVPARPALVAGPLDELAHLATAVIVIGALGTAVDVTLARALLLSSVLIDLDHVPQYLGDLSITEGTARPYPHSLLTLLLVMTLVLTLSAGGRPWKRAQQAGLGVLIGLGAHFVRDLAEPESGLALLWPLDDRTFLVPDGVYAVFLATGLGVGLWLRLRRFIRRRHGTPPDGGLSSGGSGSAGACHTSRGRWSHDVSVDALDPL